MSNVIQFLESMGRMQTSAADYAATIVGMDLCDPQKQALLGRDHAALNELLGGRNKMYCMIAADEYRLD